MADEIAIEREWRTRCDALIAAGYGDVPQPTIAKYGGQVPEWVTHWYRYHTEDDELPAEAPSVAEAEKRANHRESKRLWRARQPQKRLRKKWRTAKRVKKAPDEVAEAKRQWQRRYQAKKGKEWQCERDRKRREAMKAKYSPDELRAIWRERGQRRRDAAKARRATA